MELFDSMGPSVLRNALPLIAILFYFPSFGLKILPKLYARIKI